MKDVGGGWWRDGGYVFTIAPLPYPRSMFNGLQFVCMYICVCLYWQPHVHSNICILTPLSSPLPFSSSPSSLPYSLSPPLAFSSAPLSFLFPLLLPSLPLPLPSHAFRYMWELTGDPKYREWGWKAFQSFEKHLKVPNGYASLQVRILINIFFQTERFLMNREHLDLHTETCHRFTVPPRRLAALSLNFSPTCLAPLYPSPFIANPPHPPSSPPSPPFIAPLPRPP